MEGNISYNEHSNKDITLYHSFWLNHGDYDDTNVTGGAFWHPHWRKWPPIDEFASIIAAISMIVVFFIGTAGNSTVIYLFARHKNLQTSANMYVANLASADLIMCLFNFPILIWASLKGQWQLGNIGCQIYGVIGALTGFMSINTLTAMAVDRYQVINTNNSFMQKTSKGRHAFIICGIWVYSVSWALVPVAGWGRYVLNGGRTSCCFDYLTRDSINLAFIVCLFIFCFTIQLFVILYCYTSMLVFICRHERAFLSSDLILKTDKATRKKIKLELKVARLVFIIVSAFCLSWMPFAVVTLIGAFGDSSYITPTVSIVPGLLAKISTAINPMLYAISHPKFQSKLRASCPKCPVNRLFKAGKAGDLTNMYHASMGNPSGQMLASLKS
ncbi:hypothetical protein LOTGIDRAFT_154846 [Lottia gigantea]|uniref:G-protein coupled receptors family 1 profile domain-containing protein n=1 Tax=Lottia gigantea TaxID=225164 RepID=V4A259_LOTGI|nr:hypothetical protein LOTGIDRAFT_154846 [Lottia gigantea]ESO87351.1 hypothetical protein LOTGIDRAFT_154846 [Lottia gigantea]